MVYALPRRELLQQTSKNNLIFKKMRTIVKSPNLRSLLDANFYPTSFGNALEELYGQTKKTYMPAVNVKEAEDQFSLEFMVPGFSKDEIKVDVDEKRLTVSAEHHSEKNLTKDSNYVRKEFGFHSFQRIFTLPENVEKDALSAKYENGILHISIPKKSMVKIENKKTIEVL